METEIQFSDVTRTIPAQNQQYESFSFVVDIYELKAPLIRSRTVKEAVVTHPFGLYHGLICAALGHLAYKSWITGSYI